MSDLIERLRSPTSGNVLLCRKAADEIERLQSRLRDRQNALDHAIDYGHRKDAEIERLQNLYDIAVADRVRMHTEIERLKALEGWVKVSNGLKCPNCNDEGFTPYQDGYGYWYQEQCEFCYTVPDSIFNRRAALEGEK